MQPMTAYREQRTGLMDARGWYDGDGGLPMKRIPGERVGELEGHSRIEMDGMHTARPPPAYANELAGESRAELPGE